MSEFGKNDKQLIRDKSFLSEILDAKPHIIARLQEESFSDIRDVDIMAICALRGYLSLEAVVCLAADLKIPDRDLASAPMRLTSSGYLEMRGNPSTPGRKTIKPTLKGQAVARIIMETMQIQRWAGVRYRRGDIVICSIPKSGTTWMQMICALLIFQTPELPAPLQELSLWLDPDGAGGEDVLTRLEAQQHRRFMKTHLRLSELPLDPQVNYVVVARHPLAAALSFYHHLKNTQEGSLPPGVKFPSLDEAIRFWLDPELGLEGLPGDFLMTIPEHFLITYAMTHLRDSWARRDEPNVILIHYDDLLTDLAGQMRALAARTGITVPETTWPRLVQAATFQEMRAKADRIQPSMRDPKGFFRSGTSGGRQHISDSQIARYRELAAQLAPPDLLAWVNREDDFSEPA